MTTTAALALPVVATSLVAHRYLGLSGAAGIASSRALGVGFGIGLSSIPFFLWRLLGLPLGTYPLADVALWLVVAALAFYGGHMPPPPARSDRSWIVSVTAIALIAALSAAVIQTRLAHVPHGEWDAWAYWQVRASFLSAPEGWRNTFSPGNGSDYPLMLPAAVARVWTIAGYSPAAPAAVAVMFAVSTAALLVGALWRTSPLSAAAGAGLLLVPEFLFHGTGQCADVPLAYFALAGGIALSGSRTVRMAAVSGMALGLAAWTKNEGLVVAAALPAAFAVVSWRDTEKAKVQPLVIGLLAGMAPAFIALLLYHFVIDPPTGLAAGLVQTGPVTKLTDWSRHQAVLHFVAVHTARWGLWVAFSPVWIVAAWTIVGLLSRRGHPAITASRLTVLAMLGATYLVYVLTPYDLGWHMLTSWTRIVAQVWPLAVWTSLAWIGHPRNPSASLVRPEAPASNFRERESQQIEPLP